MTTILQITLDLQLALKHAKQAADAMFKLDREFASNGIAAYLRVAHVLELWLKRHPSAGKPSQ